jgi:hypothetical protein
VNRDDILCVAKRAGISLAKRTEGESLVYVAYDSELVRFAELIEAAVLRRAPVVMVDKRIAT